MSKYIDVSYFNALSFSNSHFQFFDLFYDELKKASKIDDIVEIIHLNDDGKLDFNKCFDCNSFIEKVLLPYANELNLDLSDLDNAVDNSSVLIREVSKKYFAIPF